MNQLNEIDRLSSDVEGDIPLALLEFLSFFFSVSFALLTFSLLSFLLSQLDELESPNPDSYLQKVLFATQNECDNLDTWLTHFQNLTQVVRNQDEEHHVVDLTTSPSEEPSMQEEEEEEEDKT